MESPTVTVLMCVYNGERYLREAIKSVLSQTFTDFEFLIVDDASTDSTWEILQEYETRDPRIRLVRNPNNIGLTKSLNKGLEAARGQYIARMDADDISLAERLEKQINFLEDNLDVGGIGSAVRPIGSSGEIGDVWTFPEKHSFIKWSLCFFYNPIVHPTVMVRRNILRQVGGYNEEMTVSQDYELWSRLVHLTDLANLPDVLLMLRKHEANITSKHIQEQQQNSALIAYKMITHILNESISFEKMVRFCDFVWNSKNLNSSDLSYVVKVIRKLYQMFLRDSLPNCIEKKRIQLDAIQRVSKLLHGRAYDMRILKAHCEALIIKNFRPEYFFVKFITRTHR